MATFVLIDDSKIARSFLRSTLEGFGHTIVGEATNGQDAIELYRTYNPDIITLDAVMPGMSGVECLTQILEINPLANVIMVTSVGRESLASQVLGIGAKAVVVKPIDEQEVKKAVDAITATM